MLKSNNCKFAIGLSIYSEINTSSKLFSSAQNDFVADPNTNITEVCCGEPGALPVLNRQALEKAIVFAKAINGKVASMIQFERKVYFDPRSPKNFQITQNDMPLIKGGRVLVEMDDTEKIFLLDYVALEEDLGVLHDCLDFTGVDFNRAGISLLKVVSKPCMDSPKEAVLFAKTVKKLLEHFQICRCDKKEEVFRFEASVSVVLQKDSAMQKVLEIKNMRSFCHIETAINKGICKLIEEYKDVDNLETARETTFYWNTKKEELVFLGYEKESLDYCYHQELDLSIVHLSENEIFAIQNRF